MQICLFDHNLIVMVVYILLPQLQMIFTFAIFTNLHWADLQYLWQVFAIFTRKLYFGNTVEIVFG